MTKCFAYSRATERGFIPNDVDARPSIKGQGSLSLLFSEAYTSYPSLGPPRTTWPPPFLCQVP
jgi:hypothetical protein